MAKNKLPKLKDKADHEFSRYIRLRDSDFYQEDEEGFSHPAGKCITCPKIGIWKYMDCGHFISRNCTPLRWDERNANLQCKGCNGPRKGEQYKHGKAITDKFGGDVMEELLEIEREWKGSVTKLKTSELEEIIEYYKRKADALS